MAVMEKRTIYISQPVLGDEEWEACREPLHSGWVTQGPKVKAFEEAFAKIHGVKHAFAVTSCTTGLHLALAALNIGPGDDVLIPAFTWVSTANAVLYVGANPVFVDEISDGEPALSTDYLNLNSLNNIIESDELRFLTFNFGINYKF